MPLYEYKCLSCGGRFEALQKFSDDPVATHAECGGAAQRLISAPSFHFKGTGWYATDYAKSNGSPDKTGEGKTGDGKAGDSKKGDGKSDSGSGESKSGESKTDSASKNESSSAKTESKPSPAAASESK